MTNEELAKGISRARRGYAGEDPSQWGSELKTENGVIPNIVQQLKVEVGNLDEVVMALENRLAGVSRAALPVGAAVNECVERKRTPESELGLKLLGFHRDVERIRNAVLGIIERLEV